jgi:hypothetical protein
MNAKYERLWNEAVAAGRAAGEAVAPVPMVVSEGSGGHQWYVADGVCGFAWVDFPGNDAFGRWAKKSGRARKSYPSGLSHWVGDFNQSMQRKEAYAHAFAGVLRAAGIRAYAKSRMD